tara:strand:+ start:40118 stop:41977 length:1860 start_codon:yes stop_codon:yes gene_type:complete
MNLLSVEDVSKRYGDRLLFNEISFGIQKGQKTALVAKNGTGKTSLLKIIAGIEPPDTGKVTFRKDITVAILDQDPKINGAKTILENVLQSEIPSIKVLREYEIAIHTEDFKAIENLIPEMDRLKLWDTESKITQILGVLNLHDVHRLATKLSGGEEKRIALAAILFSNPDLIILDEPTNHLDLEMIEWLEKFLSASNVSLLMVTHDRYFLENVCDNIIEIDNEQLYSYQGNFTYYLTRKAERQANDSVNLEKAKNVFRKELDWIRRQPKARTTKSKARVDNFDGIKQEASKNLKEESIAIDFKPERLGNKIIELHNISKSYDDKMLFSNFNYKFQKGEKVGIAGKNGAGKTTLLNIITGTEQSDTGKVVVGETVSIGIFNQAGLKLKKDVRVIEVLRDIAEVIEQKDGKTVDAARLLEKFLFNRKEQHKFVSTLSGGEKRRLYLVSVLMSNPNFLILDEPTNDLDIITLSILEDYIKSFIGCVVLVTHDRYLLDKVADHTFVFEGDEKIKDHVGKYSDYRESLKLAKLQATKTKNISPKIEKPKKESKNKLTYKDKLKFETLDKEIPVLENKKGLLNEEISSGNLPSEELVSKIEELSKISEEIETKSVIWIELAELYQ